MYMKQETTRAVTKACERLLGIDKHRLGVGCLTMDIGNHCTEMHCMEAFSEAFAGKF